MELVVTPLSVIVNVLAVAVIELPETVLTSAFAYTPLKLATALIAADLAIALDAASVAGEALSSTALEDPTATPLINYVFAVIAPILARVPPAADKVALLPTPISLVFTDPKLSDIVSELLVFV